MALTLLLHKKVTMTLLTATCMNFNEKCVLYVQ